MCSIFVQSAGNRQQDSIKKGTGLEYGKFTAGMVAGAIVGFFAFRLLGQIGLYAIALPGAAVGYGGGYFLTKRSIFTGLVAAGFAMVAMVLSEWYLMPFVADGSLSYFIKNLFDLPTAKLVLMAIGVAMGFWFGLGRDMYLASPVRRQAEGSPNARGDDQ